MEFIGGGAHVSPATPLRAGSTTAKYVVNDYGTAAVALGVDYALLQQLGDGSGNSTAAADASGYGAQVSMRA